MPSSARPVADCGALREREALAAGPLTLTSLAPVPATVLPLKRTEGSPMLTTFDKIRLASLAVARAEANCFDQDRFQGEFETAVMWTNHRVNFSIWDGEQHNYVSGWVR